MKHVLFLFLTLAISTLMASNVYAQRKQKNAEAKPFNWKEVRPDKLSGDKDIDDYILHCDTIWDRIQTYRDSVTFFKIDTVATIDNDGTPCYAIKIRDENGVERGFMSSMLQYLQWTSTGLFITADAAIINLTAVSATAAMTNKLSYAVTYGPCIKAAPKVTGIAFGEIKYITENSRKQAKAIKELRAKQADKSTDQTILIPINEEDVDLTAMIPIDEFDLGQNDDTTNIPDELLGLL